MHAFLAVSWHRTSTGMGAPDYSELRNAAGAIRLAVSMLRGGNSAWLSDLGSDDEARIRTVLRALDCATAELVRRVGTDTAEIAAETARAIASRAASRALAKEQASGLQPVTDLATVLRQLEVATALEAPPRPLLALDVSLQTKLPVDAAVLVPALQSAAFGLAGSLPPRRQPWTVSVTAAEDFGPGGEPVVVLELRCGTADDAASDAPKCDFAATLPTWLHGCLRLTEACGGGLTRVRDGAHELVRVILPRLTAEHSVADLVAEAAANDDPSVRPAVGPRRVA
ncbi:MAG: hypothetical protein JKY37_20305 [Nannocystaceae bacterium]|nr:hypothetical protein [Nannocystaceae bacterium]